MSNKEVTMDAVYNVLRELYEHRNQCLSIVELNSYLVPDVSSVIEYLLLNGFMREVESKMYQITQKGVNEYERLSPIFGR